MPLMLCESTSLEFQFFSNVLMPLALPPSLPSAQTLVLLGWHSGIVSTRVYAHAMCPRGADLNGQHSPVESNRLMMSLQLEQHPLSQVTAPRGRLMLRCP